MAYQNGFRIYTTAKNHLQMELQLKKTKHCSKVDADDKGKINRNQSH
jgi:hypothetical protein